MTTTKPGWQGRYFEDFEIGDLYKHPLGRTVTQQDNIAFTLMTLNTAHPHFDANYAAHTEFKKPLVNSCLTIALVTGQSVQDVSQNVFANLGWDEVRLPSPLYEGDTVYSETEILEKRESKSRPGTGIVTVRTIGYTQNGDIVISFKRTLLVYRRGHGPSASYRPEPKRDARGKASAS